jgi:hypothetical protein
VAVPDVAGERPRSVLLQRVLEALRDHPHDDTPARVAARLGNVGEEEVVAALAALLEDGLVMRAEPHWQLTLRGWQAAGRGLPD